MKKFTKFFIGLVLGVFLGIGINSIYAESTSNKNQNSVGYETIYADGQRYLVFISHSGDIEVFRK